MVRTNTPFLCCIQKQKRNNSHTVDLDSTVVKTVPIPASGMGLTTYTAARILKGQLQNQTGEETVMTMDTFPSVGLVKVKLNINSPGGTAIRD